MSRIRSLGNYPHTLLGIKIIKVKLRAKQVSSDVRCI